MANNTQKIVFGSVAGVGALVSAILAETYHNEGGYANVAGDRGGETHSGVTIAVARQAGYKGKMKDFSRECYTEEDVCADKIYYTDYIVKPGYLEILKINEPVGAEVIDTGILMGQARSSMFFQQAINERCDNIPKLKVDGRIGSGTLTTFQTCQVKIGKVTFCEQMIDSLDAKQKDRFDAIVRNNPIQKKFYKGWINRRIGNVDKKTCKA